MSIGIYLQAKEWTGILGKPKKEKLPEKFYSESEEEEDESASTSSSGKRLESNLYFHCLENCLQNCLVNKKKKQVANKARAVYKLSKLGGKFYIHCIK